MNVLSSLAEVIDQVNERIGRATAWIALAMVLVQFVVVLMRYIFGLGSIFLQESVIYMHAILFLIGAGYTLLHGGHVRVDIFYRGASARKRALVDFCGVFVLLIPVCILIWWSAWPYVSNSWRVFEGSKETSGIPAVFLLKSLILAFAALVSLQGISLALRSLLALAGITTAPPPDEPIEGV